MGLLRAPQRFKAQMRCVAHDVPHPRLGCLALALLHYGRVTSVLKLEQEPP